MLLATAIALDVSAQSGTNSPYSQFGLGALSDQSTGFNRGMGGVGVGFHESNQVNPLNPASYASVDSLSFIFDAAVAGQITNFKEGTKKIHANNANFEYVVAAFRAFKHVGVSFGVMPYTNVGYNYSSTQTIDDVDNTYAVSTYSGSGGLNQVYLGIGVEPVKGLAIGGNVSYLYGTLSHTLSTAYTNSYANRLVKTTYADVRDCKFDLGAQYTLRLSKNDAVTLGATYGFGRKVGGDPQLSIISSNQVTGVADTTTFKSSAGNSLSLEMPTTIGVGLMYNHANRLKVGVDYTLQQWGSVLSPVYTGSASDASKAYAMTPGQYKDLHKVALGLAYCPLPDAVKLSRRIRYSLGFSYATPYYYINGHDGPKEMAASFGFGVPIHTKYSSRHRSVLNISGQWVNRNAKNFINENAFRLTIGLTFNERMFDKWKVQ